MMVSIENQCASDYWGEFHNPVAAVRRGIKVILAGENVKLTQRETQCMLFLMGGNTAKETAKVINISHRTVEGYIDAVKEKLGCRSKLQLLSIMHSSRLIKQLRDD